MTSDKDIDKEEEDEEEDEDEEEEEEGEEEEEDDDEQQDNILSSSDPGEVHMDNTGVTLNGDLDNIFDDDDAVGPGQGVPGVRLPSILNMGENNGMSSADMHLSSTGSSAAAVSSGASININNAKVRPSADALDQGQTWQNESNDRQFRKSLMKDM